VIDLAREFPCFTGFAILALLVLVFVGIMAAENVAIARIKAKALADIQIEKIRAGKGEDAQ
jgi:hypothetical protein